jgi:hypothetical protein
MKVKKPLFGDNIKLYSCIKYTRNVCALGDGIANTCISKF